MKDTMERFMCAIYERIGKQGAGSLRNEEPRGLRAVMRRQERASCHGRITGECGETMEVFLKVSGERIEEATFLTDGCGSSVLCGYLAARLSEGRTMDEAIEIGGDTILMHLPTLPPSETHCATLAAEALHAAIHRWMAADLETPSTP